MGTAYVLVYCVIHKLSSGIGLRCRGSPCFKPKELIHRTCVLFVDRLS
jgi:hypothetical protein